MSNKVHVGHIGTMDEHLPAARKIMILGDRAKSFPANLCKTLWRVGRDDPRRVVHALKVGVSLTLVSLLYLIEPLFKSVGGNSAIWAVMTVVVVLEFTAGATLCKGLNRGLGTLIAGSLAFFIEVIATDSGKVFKAVFIGASVFVIGALATYLRFVPYIKKNFDYGVVIFLLTFNLLTVSSYRVESVLKMAHERFYTIAIGCAVCLFMTLLVFPIWSGEDLHKSTVAKFHGLAQSIQACVDEYFEDNIKEETEKESSEDAIYGGYRTVLDSKSTDEALALYASWEPRHTRECNRFPWEQYVKIGAVLRQFGYTVVALHGCLQTEIQTPRSVRALFKDPCVRLAGEVSKVLTELADSIQNRRHSSPEILSDHLHVALHDLNSAIKSQPKLFLGSNLNHHRTTTTPRPSNHKPNAALSIPPFDPNTVVSRHNNLQNAAVSLSPLGQNNKHQEAAVSLSPIDQNDGLSVKVNQNFGRHGAVSLTSVRTDTSALLEFRRARKDRESAAAAAGEKRTLRTQLSKMAVMTSLEFSEALPFAAFASLLVEIVARLDNIIEEVEELGRIACFKEYDKDDDDEDRAVVGNPSDRAHVAAQNHLPSCGDV